MPDIWGIANRIHEWTEAGEVPWQETVMENAFRALLRSGIVRIQRERDGYSFTILDKAGRIMDACRQEDEEEKLANRADLSQMYELARRKALNVDSFLLEIEKDVMDGGFVVAPTKDDPDDDIPF